MSAASAARVLLFSLLARAASATDPPLVVIHAVHDATTAEDAATDGAAVRLAAELALLGLRARIAPASREVASATADATPRADILLDVAHGKVEVTFFELGSPRATLHQTLDAPPAADLAALLVVRTVELVRAVLLPTPAGTGDARPPDASPARPTAAAADLSLARPSAPAGSRAAVALTSGALLTPGGQDAAATLALAARLRVAGPFGVELTAFAPLTAQRYSTVEGRSDVTTWLAGVGVFARSAPRRLGVDGAAGGLALWLRTDGTPAPGYAATAASAVGAAVYARVGAALALGPQLAARADLLGGALARRPVVAFPDSGERPAWGRTFYAALAGLEARWF